MVKNWKGKGLTYQWFGTGICAKMWLELLVAGVSELHDAIAYDARNDAAYGGECKEEGLWFAGPSHDPFPRHHHLRPSHFPQPNFFIIYIHTKKTLYSFSHFPYFSLQKVINLIPKKSLLTQLNLFKS